MNRNNQRKASEKSQEWNGITEILIGKIVTAFAEMDIEKLVELLDEEIEYQDTGKWRFLAIIKKQFQNFKKEGDTYLFQQPSRCLGCSYGRFGFVFTGNESMKMWSLVFQIENGFLTDIYECNMMEGHHVENINESSDELPF